MHESFDMRDSKKFDAAVVVLGYVPVSNKRMLIPESDVRIAQE
jgi:hypothetical protein